MAKMQKQVVPYLTVSDGVAAIAFYKKGFGAKEIMRMPAEDEKRLMHAQLEINGHAVYLSDDFPEFSNGITGGGRTPQKLGGTPVSMFIQLTEPKEVDQLDGEGGEGGREDHDGGGRSVLGRPFRRDHRSVRAFLAVRGAVAEAEEGAGAKKKTKASKVEIAKGASAPFFLADELMGCAPFAADSASVSRDARCRLRRYDLIIVGASFAGLACARTAALRGLKVAVVERKTDPGEAVRTTGILVKEAAEETDIPSHLTRLIRGVRLYAPNGKFTDHSAPGYYFLATDTPNLLRWMADEAERAGAEVDVWRAFKRGEQTEDACVLPRPRRQRAPVDRRGWRDVDRGRAVRA